MEHGSLIDTPAQVERDESAPDWANGYDVDDLKRITTLVVDCYANAATVEMLRNATPAPLDGSTEKP
jgi:hypothetical protein